MALVKQYPHHLFVETPAMSEQDEQGDWVGLPSTREYIGRCREETEGKGSEVQVAGGVFRQFSSLIQLPRGTGHIADGTRIIVSNDKEGNDIRIEGYTLKCDVGQLHTRLWV